MPNPTYRLDRAQLARLNKLIKHTPEGCWEWQGKTTINGYGKWSSGSGRPERAIHRITYQHFRNEPIPDGMQIDHLCRNRKCCNPEHLEIVTPSENTKRQDHAGRRKTHCPRNHEYTPENTRLTKTNKRVCRTCDRERPRIISATSVAS